MSVLEEGSVWADHRPSYNDPHSNFKRLRGGLWTDRYVPVVYHEHAAKKTRVRRDPGAPPGEPDYSQRADLMSPTLARRRGLLETGGQEYKAVEQRLRDKGVVV